MGQKVKHPSFKSGARTGSYGHEWSYPKVTASQYILRTNEHYDINVMPTYLLFELLNTILMRTFFLSFSLSFMTGARWCSG